MPALFMQQFEEQADQEDMGLYRWNSTVNVWLYFAANNPNAVPHQVYNALVDSIEEVMQPEPQTGSLAEFLELMRGRIATNCGYTPDVINDLPLSFVHSLARYWQQEPPPSLHLKWFVGYEAPEKAMNHSHQDVTNFGVSQGKDIEQLPSYIQLALIKHSGLSEPEFWKQRQARRRKELEAKKKAQKGLGL